MATPRGPAAMVDAVAGLVREVLDSVAADGNSHGGVAVGIVVAVGIPGRVDVADGTVRNALNLGIDAPTPFGRDLATRIGCAVHVENDVNAGALGAAALLGVTPPSSLAYLSIGTGLAAGLVLDGRIHRGSIGMAGEVGHVPLRRDGPLCSCGQRGCAETLGSGGAIAERWGPNGAAVLWEAADAGDQVAVRVRDDLVFAISSTIRLIVLTLDVDVVALGGGVGELGEPLVRELRRWLAVEAEQSPLLAVTLVSVTACATGPRWQPGRRARGGARRAPGGRASGGRMSARQPVDGDHRRRRRPRRPPSRHRRCRLRR